VNVFVPAILAVNVFIDAENIFNGPNGLPPLIPPIPSI